MKCPFCGSDDTKVIDSRPADDNAAIRRRRQCEACDKRFTTYEKLETMPMLVIKKDNSRESYNRSKIESGILRSCHKRPVSTVQIAHMIDDIENEVFALGEREIPTSVIGEKVMRKLKDVDEVAYVRFASVYREFKDVNTFIEEIGMLLKADKKEPKAVNTGESPEGDPEQTADTVADNAAPVKNTGVRPDKNKPGTENTSGKSKGSETKSAAVKGVKTAKGSQAGKVKS